MARNKIHRKWSRRDSNSRPNRTSVNIYERRKGFILDLSMLPPAAKDGLKRIQAPPGLAMDFAVTPLPSG